MLTKKQIQATLKHCEKIKKHNDSKEMCGDEGVEYFEAMRNLGWVQALKYVLSEYDAS
tara:strand:+ start:621 stop:794 length:174 start_codon:yes stop_codon:yes gene_type:complete